MANGSYTLEGPYASTLENSCEGWMTKLSALAVHEMRCCILGSSSMLSHCFSNHRLGGCVEESVPPQLVDEGSLNLGLVDRL
jgi:hypothetical protein